MMTGMTGREDGRTELTKAGVDIDADELNRNDEGKVELK
jgi:hypothetical protein